MKRRFLTVLIAAQALSLGAPSAWAEGDRQPEMQFRPVEEENCTTVDVRNHMSPRLQQDFAVIQNQGDSGICFAITTASVWSYHMDQPGKQNPGLLSGLYYWSQYSQDLTVVDKSWRWVSQIWGDNTVVLDGGMLRPALWEAQEAGMCPESIVRTTLPEDAGGDEKNPRLAHYALLKEAIANVDNPDFDRLFDQSKIVEYFPTMKPADVKKIVRQGLLDSRTRARFSTVPDVIHEVGDVACRGHRVKLSDEKIRVITRSANVDYLLDVINGELNRPERPNMIGLMYDSATTIGSGNASPFSHTMGVHVSPIIGRKFNSERGYCEFLVKDSFGADNQQYIKGLYGRGKKNGMEHMIRPNKDGTFWISDLDLYLTAASISFIIPKNADVPAFDKMTGAKK